jgi:hypothetical protein
MIVFIVLTAPDGSTLKLDIDAIAHVVRVYDHKPGAALLMRDATWRRVKEPAHRVRRELAIAARRRDYFENANASRLA